MSEIRKIVLAYSGGLNTSVAIRWLVERYRCEVIAYCADVGQEEDLEALRARALATGASHAIVEDRREAFVENFVFPALRAAAVYEGEYLLGTALARPCITQGMMDAVAQLDADAISHGATGRSNDQVRFELAAYHFKPDVKIVAPWREWEFRSRAQLIAHARQHAIPTGATLERPYSVDRNLFHVSYEGGILEDPWREPDGAMFQRTQDPEKAPTEPRYVEIEFEGGDPIAVDGRRLPPAELLMLLNAIAGEHGVGRADLVEDRIVGTKSRGVYETPGGTVLHRARRAVESLTLDREVMRVRDDLVPRYAGLVYGGCWFTPEREALQVLIDDIARPVTGIARVKLYRGAVTLAGRKAPRSLCRAEAAPVEDQRAYDPRDASGFIKLNALRLRIRSQLDKR